MKGDFSPAEEVEFVVAWWWLCRNVVRPKALFVLEHASRRTRNLDLLETANKDNGHNMDFSSIVLL
jgi:hypothetical protein